MGWETRPLASICEVFADGDWIESKDQSDAGIRLIQTGNVGEGAFKDRGEKARYVSAETFRRLRCTEIFPGDCLISRLPDPVGRACIIPETGESMITAVDCTIVRFRKGVYLPEFFTYYSQSNNYLAAVDVETTGTTRKRISRARLGHVAVPATPLPEQRRIVAILDEAFEAIATTKANTEKNLQNARELLGRYLATVFGAPGRGWDTRALGEAVRFIDYRGKTPPKREEGIRLITAKNVKMGIIQREPEEFVDPGVYDGWMTRGLPRSGDVLFTTEAPLGNVAQLDTDEKVVIGQRLITMQPLDAALDRTFLKYALMSPPIQASIHAKATGATVLGIKASLLKTVHIWYPKARAEQLRLVGLISAVEDEASVLRSLASRKLAAFDELKKSLLHQAFAGQLTAKSTDQQLAEVA